MTRSSTCAVSPSQQQTASSRSVILSIAASVLVLALTVVPSASADCSRRALLGGQSIPSMPATAAQVSGSPAANSNQKGPVSIVGLWNLNFLSGGVVVDVAFDAWHSDGTEVLNDYTNPINGNVCLGIWEQTGARTYKLKHPSWYFDGSGSLLGTVIIRETIRLSADGNSFSGTYSDDIYDVSGNFQEELSGQVKATRITVD